jgi:hypothetical protein
MRGPPDPDAKRGPWQAPRNSRKSSQQQRYTIPEDIQAFVAALLPMSFPLLCLLTSWGVQR